MVVFVILILTLRMDVTKSSHCSKCKACLGGFPRQFYLNFFCPQRSTMSPWVNAEISGFGLCDYLLFFVTNIFVNNSIGCGHLCVEFCFLWADIVLFQAIFVLTLQHNLSSTADIPTPLFGFTHSVSSPSLVSPSVLNSLTGNVLLNLTLNSQHRHRQCVHLYYFLLNAPDDDCYLCFPSSSKFKQ